MYRKCSWLSAPGLRGGLLALALVQLTACTTAEERAQKYLASAQELLAKGEEAKANIEFRNALKQKKDLVAAWRGLAKIEERRKNLPALGPILRTILEHDPADQDARLKLGRLMLLAGALDQALPLIAVLSDSDKPSADAVALKAGILLGLKDPEGARREAQRALSLQPDNLDAALILASYYLSKRDPGKALEALANGNVQRENEPVVALLRIQIFEQMGDDAQLEAELRKLIDFDPSSSILVRRQLVKFYLSRGRELDAERELRAAVSADPANIEAFMEVVRFLNTKSGSDAAQQELEQRIAQGGDVFAYRLALAEFDFLRNRHTQAIHALEKLSAETVAPDRKLKTQLRLATIHIHQKNFAAAEPVIADILKTDSRNTDALRLRGIVRIQQGQLESAITDFRQALNDQPQSPPLLQLLATALERTGAIELAEKHYADATRASQFEASVGLQYVAFLQRRGSAVHAEDLLTELATRNPTNVQVWTALGQAKLLRRDWVGAQEVADAIKRLGDQRGLADQLRAAAFSGQNKLNESIRALQMALQAAPNALQPMVALVRAYIRAQQTSEAEVFLRGVLSANPANAEALVLLGSVQLVKNAPDQAEKEFHKAIERQPRNAVGYSALAEFYLRRNDADRAIETVQRGLKEQPDHFGLRFTLAAALEAKEDYEGAIKEYEEMLARQPDSLVVANNLASLLSDYRDDKASIERAQALGAILRKSDVPHFKDTVGWLNYRAGDYRRAVALLEEAVEAMPATAQVRYHLGMSYLKTGQTEKAREQFKKASELEQRNSKLKNKIQAALEQDFSATAPGVSPA